MPTSHSSDKNAPVKAIGGVVLVGIPTGGAGARDVVVVGKVTGPAIAVTLPGTYVMV